MTTKHFLNEPATLVQDSLKGLALVNPRIRVDIKNKVVYQKNQQQSVAIISGGGSGHEPAHSGFVGSGMLTAAVCGNIFASPNPGQVQRALELVQNPKGTLIIVKNYTGDILNFGLAKERYAAAYPQQANLLRFVVVADDVAVGRTQGAIVGRRGLAGTVLVYKIAGSLAKQGGSLNEVEQLAQLIASRVGTIGIGLNHCHVPGTEASLSLKDDEYEIGMGIHNESGHQRSSPIPSVDKLVDEMITMLVSTTDPERSFLPFKDDNKEEVVLLVNNLGGTDELELGAVAAAAILELRRRGFVVKRALVGTFMTSLAMPGVSLTLLVLPRPDDQVPFSAKQILEYLDDAPDVVAWKLSVELSFPDKEDAPEPPSKTDKAEGAARCVTVDKPNSFVALVKAACEALQKAEPEITKMDQVGGDGDCGFTLRNGAEGVLKMISAGRITGKNLIDDVRAITDAVGDTMDGTSGALYSIFFSALAQSLYDAAPNGEVQGNIGLAGQVLSAALERLYTYTRARPPSRTLVDPLDAFIVSLKEDKSWKKAAEAAQQAVENTKNLPAKAGRAAYVEQKNLADTPDPGAWGVKIITEAITRELQ